MRWVILLAIGCSNDPHTVSECRSGIFVQGQPGSPLEEVTRCEDACDRMFEMPDLNAPMVQCHVDLECFEERMVEFDGESFCCGGADRDGVVTVAAVPCE